MRSVLTVAGSDPSSGAGIQIDIRVFHSLGLHPLSAVSVITVQNSIGVKRALSLDPSLVIEQVETLLEDFPVRWLKTGLLGSASVVEALTDLIKKRDLKAVVDPVMISTSGYPFIDEDTIEAFKEFLIPTAEIITPNLKEAEILTGIRYKGPSSIEEICEGLKAMGPGWVVLKGGHVGSPVVEDILFDGHRMERFTGPKIEGEFHGTGCVFSAALTGFRAMGMDVREAVKEAKVYVQRAIQDAYRPARGIAYLRV